MKHNVQKFVHLCMNPKHLLANSGVEFMSNVALALTYRTGLHYFLNWALRPGELPALVAASPKH
jgi:hypothetical protein